MNIVLFEDSKTDRLYPLHFTRHVSEFLCGRFTLKERMERLYPGEKIFFWGREYLKGYFLEKYPGLRYNSFTEGETLFLNARFIPLERITPRNEETGTADGETAYFFLRKPAIKNLSPDGLLRGSGFSGGLKKKNANGYFVRHLWDFNKINGELIRSDFPGKRGSVPRGASLPGDQACFGKGVRVSPLSVIDTAAGPVILEDGTAVEPFVYLKGPVVIGKNSLIKSGTVIYGPFSCGEQVKLGGEISSSILLSFSSKQHGGFLGNSYTGSWTNLGAGTISSNLKNSYTGVDVVFPGKKLVSTGEKFAGLFLSDYSRTAIGTCFNTGTSVGLCSQVRGYFPSKFIPSFVFQTDKEREYDLLKAVHTIMEMKKRRKKEMGKEEERLLHLLFSKTSPERKAYLKKR